MALWLIRLAGGVVLGWGISKLNWHFRTVKYDDERKQEEIRRRKWLEEDLKRRRQEEELRQQRQGN